ncbi:hypothetical protein [Caldimonas tepidiphila]|uniref:hypothetical protein n=1 Tax=Caldimonas tepidiphila TaxID=2315841 RepID=UPI001300B548|nr:hypothetical protein [Caldimonas tepidiphila]
MNGSVDDFALGRAAGYRAALLALWAELREMDPGTQKRLIKACLAGVEEELAHSLPSRLISEDFLSGLHTVATDVEGMSRASAESEPPG